MNLTKTLLFLTFLNTFFTTLVSGYPIVNNQQFYILLKQQNLDKLEAHLYDVSNPYSPNYGNYMTTDEIDKIIAPKSQLKEELKDWLASNQVNILQEYSDALIVDHEIVLPYQFSELIDFSFRLGDVNHHLLNNKYKLSRRLKTGVNVDSGLVGRDVLRRLYKIDDQLLDQTKISLGPMEYLGQSGFSQDDLVHVQLMNDLPKNPVPKDHIIGPNGFPDGESELDIQLMTQVAANADLWYEDFNGWMYEWALNFYNRKNVPQIVSISWGWAEDDQCSIAPYICQNSTSRDYVKRGNTEFMKLALRGISIMVSSGDAGSPGRTNEACDTTDPNNYINPVFPGSSPWITSVGGTYLVADNAHFDYHTKVCREYVSCANGTVEQGVTFDVNSWTSGSAFSLWTDRPFWQNQAVENYLKSGVSLPNDKYWNKNGRGYPDVSSNSHNCLTYSDNAWIGSDGTSCSSPVFAGVVAVLNNHQLKMGKKVLGYLNLLLYSMYENDPSTFNDVLVGNSTCTEFTCCGNDFGFLASKGWDPVGGLGTPNVERMMAWLDRHT